MNKELIIQNVEDLINGKIYSIDPALLKSSDDPIERYMINTVRCLENEYQRYRRKRSGNADFLGALRSFLLSFHARIHINNPQLLGKKDFGIYPAGDGTWFAVADVPEGFKYPSFVEAAFINQNTLYERRKSKYLLQTNPFIYQLTGFETFKSFEQKLCVHGALNTPDGYTALICMPTGGGKSLVTQAVAYSHDRSLTIVVVPTVSLAIDQARAAALNIKSRTKSEEIFAYYAGVQNPEQILGAIKEKRAKILFISPEALLKNQQFKDLVKEAAKQHYLHNIVIDEAHIVVSWGDSFRVDYQCLEPWRKELLKFNPDLKTYLLSATFDDRTADLLKSMFKTDDRWVEIRCDALRKEPRFSLIKVKGPFEKRRKVLELVNKLPHPMIIYVHSPYAANGVKKILADYGYINVQTFTGETDNTERERLIHDWVNNRFEIMIATSAFGVGVDKPDVRTVLHLYIPESADTYYQELGRGGRDRLPCLSVMCVDPIADFEQAGNHVTKVLTTEKLKNRWLTLFTNPGNIWQNGKILMDMSLKPNEGYFDNYETGNQLHQQWNINAVLLLRRHGLLEINEIKVQEKKYYMMISNIDDRLKQDGELLTKLLDELRSEEQSKAFGRLNVLKKQIDRDGDYCWSEMFYDTYSNVSECCPGCDEHQNEIIDEYDGLPLRQSVSGPQRTLTKEASKYFQGVHEAMCLTEGRLSDTLGKFKKIKYSAIITDQPVDRSWALSDAPDLTIMNFSELHDLLELDNNFYISGLILAVYDNDKKKLFKQFSKVHNFVSQSGGYAIHVVAEDVRNGSGKPLSELIDGSIVNENLMNGDEV